MIEQIDVMSVYPDPANPRRIVPSDQEIRGIQPSNAYALLFKWWSQGVLKAVGHTIDFADFIFGYIDDDDLSKLSEHFKQSKSFQRIVDILQLAKSIYDADGLINPISVVQTGKDQYQIETGERRWCAFIILHSVDGGAFSLIPAIVRRDASAWRQASENNQRAELNAISMARQIARLLMDDYGGIERFGEPPAAGCDREYWAAVEDGSVFPIPRGRSAEYLTATGLKNGVQLRQYRRLLRLPDNVWTRADDESWTENHLRSHLKDDADPRNEKEAQRLRLDLKISRNFQLGLITKQQADNMVFEEVSPTISDSRLRIISTGEIVGGPQRRPADVVLDEKKQREIAESKLSQGVRLGRIDDGSKNGFVFPETTEGAARFRRDAFMNACRNWMVVKGENGDGLDVCRHLPVADQQQVRDTAIRVAVVALEMWIATLDWGSPIEASENMTRLWELQKQVFQSSVGKMENVP